MTNENAKHIADLTATLQHFAHSAREARLIGQLHVADHLYLAAKPIAQEIHEMLQQEFTNET